MPRTSRLLPQPVKILYHHRTQAEDGQAVHIRALMRAFEEEGHRVREVGLVRRGSREPAPAATDAAADGSGGRGWGWIGRVPRFARELAEYSYTVVGRGRLLRSAADFEPDFIYERYAFGNAGGIQAARRCRRPIVLEVNSPMVLELERTRGLSFPRTARRLESWIFRSATRVCAVSGVLRDMLVDMGVEAERILVTPNGVHLQQYGRTEPAEARRALELPPDGPLLGFVGYFRDWHRLDLVVRALTRPELSGARLALIGEGPARPGLEALAGEGGVGDRLHFLGRRPHPEIPSLLPAFDVALVPAIKAYASPLKLHEYMASGLAVVAPDQPNLREVLTHGENALLVRPGDADEMLAALIRLVGDPELRRRLGEAARRTIVERDLTWRGNARRVVAAVEELA